MKKILITLTLFLVALTFLNVSPSPVYASTKVVAKSKVTVKTTMKWDASALKIVTKPSSFDHSNVIRNAYIKKVEAYAKRNHIKVITAKVVNGMRE
ncbi:MAG: hypothetical protein WCK59_03085 [Candidatus Falkowbacteria bacterium]